MEVNRSYPLNKQGIINHKFLGSCELKAPLCEHIYWPTVKSNVDQASFEIMLNISQHDNHFSQQMPADMSTIV